MMQTSSSNPYFHLAAIHTSDMFFGRRNLLHRFYAAIANHQSVSLVGSRHIGKSSFLWCVCLPEIQEQFPFDLKRFIFIPLDLREYLYKTSDDFFRKVSKEIILQSQKFLDLTPQVEGQGEETFSLILDQIEEHGFHPVLLLDAFEKVTLNKHFEPEFFDFLRAYATLGQISYVTATNAPLYELSHQGLAGSPFFNIFQIFKLGVLEPEEAQELIRVPALKVGIPFTEEEVVWVLKLASWHPFFIQRVCHTLLDMKMQRESGMVNLQLVSNLAYKDLEPYFRNIWNQLTQVEQTLLQNEAQQKKARKYRALPELSASGLFRLFVSNTALDYYNKGNALRDLRQYAEALAAYEEAIALSPNQPFTYFSKGFVLYNLKRYNEALAAYEKAILLNPNLELEAEFPEGIRNLRLRVKLVQEFLSKAGFKFRTSSNVVNFIAAARTSSWRERFPKGLYIDVLIESLDRKMVQLIYDAAAQYSDHVLVVTDQRPEISGWVASNELRVEKGFTILPITESLIRESIASNKEFQTLHFYINDRLGKDFDPYDLRDPVSDAFSFFGREGLADEILNTLRLGNRLGLFGLHKMGKSSLMQKLQKKSEYPIAYIYLKRREKLSNIYKRILSSWLIDLRIKYPNLDWMPPSSERECDPLIFDTAAKELLMSLSNVTDTPFLGIFLDEIEHIVPYKEGDEETLLLYLNLMDGLRALQQETNGLFLLVAGVHPNLARHNYFWGNQKNPMHQVISERFLLPLDKDDCSYMIRSLGQQISMTYNDDALEYIIQMSGAHPFLARQLCSLAYKKRGSINVLTIQDMQKIAQEFVHNPATASYFDDHGLWGELGKQDIWGKDIGNANHKILRLIAASPGRLTEASIYSKIDRKTAEQSLRALKERGILSSAYSSEPYFYITFGLFRDWISLHKLGAE